MITYIFKSSLTLLLLFGFYWFLLRKEKMFVFNRYFLLSSVIFSLLIPLISIPVNFHFTSQVNNILSDYNDFIPEANPTNNALPGVMSPGQITADTRSPIIDLSAVLLILYISGTILFLIRFLRNIYTIVKKTIISEKINFNGYRIVLTNENSCPCCFLNKIFLNRDDYYNNRIEQELVYHEIEHARQSHSIDIILIELFKIFYWFNPVYLLYDRAIRINHEYLADNGVVSYNHEVTGYACKILNFINGTSSIPLTSGSNYSFIKNRIFMLTKSQPGKSFKGIRILLSLSLMTLLLGLMSFQNSGRVVKGFVVNKYGKHLSGVQIKVSEQNSKITSDAMGHFVIENVPENAIITFSSKNYTSQSATPVFSSEMVIRLYPDVSNDELKKNYKDYFPETGSNPLIVINGVAEESLSMADIDPTNKVAAFKILTDKDAATRYGEKAKNGAIEIITVIDQKNSDIEKAGKPQLEYADSVTIHDKKIMTLRGNVRIRIPDTDSKYTIIKTDSAIFDIEKNVYSAHSGKLEKFVSGNTNPFMAIFFEDFTYNAVSGKSSIIKIKGEIHFDDQK